MDMMFFQCERFNSDISAWDVSRVTNIHGMFSRATRFNIDIGAWDTSAVKDMSWLLEGAASFNQDLRRWATGAVNMDRRPCTGCSYLAAGARALNPEYLPPGLPIEEMQREAGDW